MEEEGDFTDLEAIESAEVVELDPAPVDSDEEVYYSPTEDTDTSEFCAAASSSGTSGVNT